MRTRCLSFWVLGNLLAGSLAAEPASPQAVGLMLAPAGAQLTRAGTSTPQRVKAGDMLYAGDIVRTGESAATILYCPGKSTLTFAPSTEFLVDASQVTISSGKLDSKRRVLSCFLPPVVRLAEASTQKFGVLVSRGEDDIPLTPTPRQKWPAGLAEEMQPVELALTVANDAPSRLARAALYEKYGLLPDAILDYQELGSVWTDASWLGRKITELNAALALQRAQRPAFSTIK